MTGERLGDYAIDRELGSGGMGKVYAATGPDGVVALKVVHRHLLETPGFFKRFMREAQLEAAKRLLDASLAKVPAEHHEAMRTNLRVNREILAAWREELGGDDDANSGGAPTESPTRAG